MKKELLISIIFIFASFFSSIHGQVSEELTDERDGKKYSTVQIGEQIWMSENLNFDSGEGCWTYDDKEENAAIYGRIYTWDAAQEACPSGWHLPSDKEWEDLIKYLGGPLKAGGKLKKKGEDLWKLPNIASNESGFSALPGGYRFDYGDYHNITKVASFWTSTISNGKKAYCRGLRNKSEGVKSSDDFVSAGRSVRCIKD